MCDTFKICWYDKGINSLINKNRIGRVLSVYKDYINILVKYNRVITIVKDNLSNLPQAHYRFVVNKKDFPNNEFNRTIFPNDKVIFSNKKIVVGVKNKLTFLLPSKNSKFLKKNFLAKHNKPNITKKGITKFLEYINFHKPQIDEKVVFLTNKFLYNLKNCNKKNVVLMIKKYIGLGQGSTPEFDDFIIGVLTSFYVFGKTKSLSQEYEKLYNLIKLSTIDTYHKTTMLSYNFLLQICEEKFSFRIIKLIENLLKNRTKVLTEVINLILSEGKNSGWWFLYGFFKTFELLNSKLRQIEDNKK
jgi:hypothetical protein